MKPTIGNGNVGSALAAGDFYPGDLLKNVMDVPETFWNDHPALRERLVTEYERSTPSPSSKANSEPV